MRNNFEVNRSTIAQTKGLRLTFCVIFWAKFSLVRGPMATRIVVMFLAITTTVLGVLLVRNQRVQAVQSTQETAQTATSHAANSRRVAH